MDNQEAYLHSIHHSYPDLLIKKIQPHHQEGQFNDILIINDDLIFRFPRYAEGIQTLITEIHILERLQGWLTLPTPNPIYTGTNTQDVSQVFMGYPMIPGQPLWYEIFQAITESETLQRLADQLAGFLKELHHIPVEQFDPSLPVHDSPAEWTSLYNDIRRHLFPFMRQEAQAWVECHFEIYLNNSGLHTYPICLRHGDFGTGNILYDPQGKTQTGIIDFGNAGLGDPALDIAAASGYGEDFFSRFYVIYPEIESMLDRSRFYKGTYALQEALHGFLNNDREAFESGIAEYR
jgi:aminoglycoside 2''-phosphotransferase